MRRYLRRTVAAAGTAAVLVAAFVACSRDGRAAAPVVEARAPSGSGQLFREAAQATPDAAVPLQGSLAPLIDKLKPAVVNISTTTVVKHPRMKRGLPGQGPRGGQDPFEDFFERYFGRPAPEAPGGPGAPDEFHGSSLGSGFLINPDGYILTNNHVVKDATDIVVRLSDGREFKANLVGRDPLVDVALIRLANPPKDLPTVTLGDSDALRQGDFVLALGSPFGLRDTATLGIVSAKHRSGINPGGTYDDFIQTDAAINPGNSGGPLFNMRGEVVGINTAIVSPSIGSGIGFAVPINMAKTILPQLKEKGKVVRGFIGVSIQDLTPDLTQAFGLAAGTKGALVQNVVPKGPAAKAGVQPGDVVVSVNGKAVDSAGTLTRAVAMVAPGDKVDLGIVRKGKKEQIAFKVTQRPQEEEVARGDGGGDEEGEGNKSPKLGVTLAPLNAQLAQQLGVQGDEGVVVTNVVDGGPAQRAGVRPGDVILEVNRQPVKRPDEVASLVGKMKEGDMALLRVRRGDTAVYVAVPVGGRK